MIKTTLPSSSPLHTLTHTLTVLSSEAVSSDCPSLAKSTHRTVAVCALNTVDSPFLCGQGVSQLIHPHTLTHPHTAHTHTHTLGSHSRTVLSREADATRLPEGEKDTDKIASYKNMAIKHTDKICNSIQNITLNNVLYF